jgi:hypothetical protein
VGGLISDTLEFQVLVNAVTGVKIGQESIFPVTLIRHLNAIERLEVLKLGLYSASNQNLTNVDRIHREMCGKMFQSEFRRVKALILFLLVVSLVQLPAEAKCVSVRLALSGEIVGSTKDLRVVVEVASATEGDSDTQVQQESSIKKSHFQIFAWFNTTSNVISAETCDRLPHLVMVKLMKGEQVLDRQTLTVERDFHRTKSDDYQLKRQITLHRPSDK